MAERMLIVKVKRTDATRAELFGARHKYPDLRLFDLGELAEVGIDFEALPIGQEVPARFWALYELSDKLNQAGRPYKDVIALEPMDKPATVASTDNTALLSELRAIRLMLAAVLEANGLQVPDLDQEPEPGGNGNGDLDRAFPRYGDGSAVSDNAAEVAAYHEHQAAEGKPAQDVAALRAWVLARRKAA